MTDFAKLTAVDRTLLLSSPDGAFSESWSAEEKQQFIDKGWRAPRAGERIGVSGIVRPLDYDNDLKRGTVEFTSQTRNYAQHSVVIPDGTAVHSCNFAQAQPATVAITGKNLTFVECNMVNCAIDPTWTLDRCNTAQLWRVPDVRNVDDIVKVASHPSELPAKLTPPVGAITSRAY